MPIREKSDDEGQLYTHVDDEQYEELSELNGQPIVHASVWEEGLAETMNAAVTATANSDDETAADIDLYLRDGVYFELYGTICYIDPDEPPLTDLAKIEERLKQLVSNGGVIEEVAVDEDDGLVLILAQRHKPMLYLQVGAWLLDEWEELPES